MKKKPLLSLAYEAIGNMLASHQCRFCPACRRGEDVRRLLEAEMDGPRRPAGELRIDKRLAESIEAEGRGR